MSNSPIWKTERDDEFYIGGINVSECRYFKPNKNWMVIPRCKLLKIPCDPNGVKCTFRKDL